MKFPSLRQASERYRHRLIRPLNRLRDHAPLTLTGLLVLAVAVTMLRVFGYGRLDLVVFALTVCAIVIILFSFSLVVLSGLAIRRQHQRITPKLDGGSLQLEAGFPNESGFRLPTLIWLPLVSLDWRVIDPDAVDCTLRLSEDGRYLEEELTPRLRCRRQQITRVFTVRDVLGLCRFAWRARQQIDLVALPRTGRIRTLPVLRSLSAEDGLPNPAGEPEGDRMEIRPYSPGDPVRNIMWGVYARSRELNVRLEEKSVFHSQRTFAYLLSGQDDEAAAAVARVAVESGALGEDWVFGADGSSHASSRVSEALEMIAASRSSGAPHPYGLDHFLEQQNDNSAHCIVFAGAGPGSWPDALRRTVARFPGQFSVILATDGFTREEKTPLIERILYSRPRDDEESYSRPVGNVTQLGGLLAELRQFAGSAMIVDRRTGMSFDQSLKRV